MQRGIEMVEFACGIPSLLMGQALENLAPQRRLRDRAAIRWASASGITPFNFPSMVPLWMFPVAITCGNTFVLKPSEKVPLSAMKLGELLDRGGAAGGRVQRRPRRQECAVDALLDASAGARRFLRRLDRASPGTSMKPARGTASACRPPAAPRTT